MGNAELRYDGQVIATLPVIEGTAQGSKGLDLGKLREDTGFCTIDHGLKNTGIRSSITFIDGEAGKLWYRGRPIEDLAKHAGFLDTALLLRHGRMPEPDQSRSFAADVLGSLAPPGRLQEFLDHYPGGDRPPAMGFLSAAMSAMPGCYPQWLDPEDPERVEKAASLAHGHMAGFVALVAQRHRGAVTGLECDPDRGYGACLLEMMRGGRQHGAGCSDAEAKAVEALLVLHADHEQNCSTTAVRVTRSSGANLFVGLVSGINALSGPLHGGATESVESQQQRILSKKLKPETIIEAVRTRRLKELTGEERLMGFGHRVYKNTDARARVLKKLAEQLMKDRNTAGGAPEPRFAFALELAERAAEDEYFLERGLYPNVDFWSGFVYACLAIDSGLWTAMFALGRTAGWIAHWLEQTGPIIRPWQVYEGPAPELPAGEFGP